MRTEKQQLKSSTTMTEGPVEEKRPMTRVELHGKKNKKRKQRSEEEEKKKKKRRISVPFVMLVIILILPITISLLAKGITPKLNSDHASGERVQISSNDGIAGVAATVKRPAEDETEAEPPKAEKPDSPPKTEKPDEPAEDKNPVSTDKPEQEKVETVKPEEPETQDEPEAGETVYHTVQQGETLYRIAMNYYQSKEGVEIIRAANGLSGNAISVGQKLVIPK